MVDIKSKDKYIYTKHATSKNSKTPPRNSITTLLIYTYIWIRFPYPVLSAAMIHNRVLGGALVIKE
jgi:hypothetical protein